MSINTWIVLTADTSHLPPQNTSSHSLGKQYTAYNMAILTAAYSTVSIFTHSSNLGMTILSAAADLSMLKIFQTLLKPEDAWFSWQ